MEKVSILVPVYNCEQYLEKALDSLSAQTWKNLEILCIDDGSTDGSHEILRAKAAQDPRIRFARFKNAGVSAARNRALSLASGEWILFVDADDWIEPDMVEAMASHAHQTKSDIVQCGYVMDFGPVPFYRPGSGHKIFTPVQALQALAKNEHLNNYPWGKLIRQSCFEDIRFPEGMPGFEDTCTIFKTFSNARRIATIPNRFYHYVQHNGSITNKMSLSTVYLMRDAYEYQQAWLKKRYPGIEFSFDEQYYNSDMVIIYTLILFSKRKENPKFVPGPFKWDRLSFARMRKAAYKAWLGIALAKLSPSILKTEAEAESLNTLPQQLEEK